MGDGEVELAPADDASTEVTTPIGFFYGGSVHHQIYVSLDKQLVPNLVRFVCCTGVNKWVNCLWQSMEFIF